MDAAPNDDAPPDADGASDPAALDGATDAASDAETEFVDLAVPVPLATLPVLAVAIAALFWWAFGTDAVLVSLLPFAGLVAAVTVIDLRELRIPNRLLQPAAMLAVPLLIVAATSDWSDVSLIRAALGALAYGGLYFVILLIYPPGMGWGDVKLAPLLGAQLGFFGWIPLVRAIVISHALSGVIAIVILAVTALLRRGGQARTAFPFGPFMVAGSVIALVLEGLS